MPALTDKSILFRTNDDDKDADTKVTVEVRDNTGELFARISNSFGKFDDQTTNGPFDLELLNRPDKRHVDGGNVLIRIDPKGNDEGISTSSWSAGSMTARQPPPRPTDSS